jgi:hypothetical protein
MNFERRASQAYQVVKRVLFVALLIAGVFVAVRLARIEQRIDGEIPQLRPAATAEIGRQGDRTRELVDKVAADLAERSERQITALRADLRAESAAYRTTLDGRLAAIQKDAANQLTGFRKVANVQLGQANASIGQLAAIGAGLQPTIQHVNEASAVLLRRDALPAQLLGLTAAAKVTLGESAQTMRDVRRAVPGFLDQGQNIATNFQAVTSNINRLTKPRWYDRLLGYGLNGVVIYRNLNPATSLTVKGAQFVASRP